MSVPLSCIGKRWIIRSSCAYMVGFPKYGHILHIAAYCIIKLLSFPKTLIFNHALTNAGIQQNLINIRI